MRTSALGLATALALASGPAMAEQYAAAHHLPVTHAIHIVGYAEWAERIKEQTNGEITWEVFPTASLYPPQSAPSAIADGLSPLGFITAGYNPSQFSATASIEDVGFAHPDSYVLLAAITDFMMNDPQVYGEWRSNGVVPTLGYATPEYYLLCTQPIRTLEDLAGKRVRTSTAGFGRLATALGAISVSIPANEIYTTMERGALDCTMGDPSFLSGSFQLIELVESMVNIPFSPSFAGASHTFSEDFWQGLTDEQRRMFLDTEAWNFAKTMAVYMEEREKGVVAAREQAEIIEPGPEFKAVLDQFVVENLAAAAQAATSLGVENPEDLMKRFDEYCVKWEGLFAQISDRNDIEAVTALLKENLYDKIDVSTFGME